MRTGSDFFVPVGTYSITDLVKTLNKTHPGRVHQKNITRFRSHVIHENNPFYIGSDMAEKQASITLQPNNDYVFSIMEQAPKKSSAAKKAPEPVAAKPPVSRAPVKKPAPVAPPKKKKPEPVRTSHHKSSSQRQAQQTKTRSRAGGS